MLGSGTMLNFKIVVCQEIQVSGLLLDWLRSLEQWSQRSMIHSQQERYATYDVMSEFLECIDHRGQFFSGRAVHSFCSIKSLARISDHSDGPMLFLLEHGSHGKVGRVGVDDIFSFRERWCKDRIMRQTIFQFVESWLLFGSPQEWLILLGQFRKWFCDIRESLNMASVIASQTNKRSYFSEILRHRPFRDSRQLVGIRFDSFFGNHAPQELYFHLEQLALGRFQFQVRRPQPVENGIQAFQMLFKGRRHNNDVVQKNQTGFPGESLHYQVHESLEDRWRVGQSERQHFKLEGTFPGDEGRFVGSFWIVFDLPVTLSQVQRWKIFGSTQRVETRIDSRKWIAILDGQVVELAVIYTESQSPVGFLHQHLIGSPWTEGGFTNIIGQHLVHVLIDDR